MKKKYPKAVELPSGSYRCQVRVDGRRVSVTAESPQEAISRAMALRDGRKEKGPQDLTLEAVVEEYIDLREAVLSPATVKAYRSYSRNRFQPYMMIEKSLSASSPLSDEVGSSKTIILAL